MKFEFLQSSNKGQVVTDQQSTLKFSIMRSFQQVGHECPLPQMNHSYRVLAAELNLPVC